MHELSEILGSVVRMARERRNLTQAELAEKIGIGQRTILDIENNRGNPRFHILFAIIKELDIPSEVIFQPYPMLTEEAFKQLSIALGECTETEKQIVIETAFHLTKSLKDKRGRDESL